MHFSGFSSYETHIILRQITCFQTLKNSSSFGFGQKSDFSENFFKNSDFSIFREKRQLKPLLSSLYSLKLFCLSKIIVHMAFLNLYFRNVVVSN